MCIRDSTKREWRLCVSDCEKVKEWESVMRDCESVAVWMWEIERERERESEWGSEEIVRGWESVIVESYNKLWYALYTKHSVNIILQQYKY